MAAASFDADARQHSAGGGALGVHAASRKIGKQAAYQQQQQRKPVIIYMVSPKVIHVEAHEFMSLVQRLTGPDNVNDVADDVKRAAGAASSSSSPRTKLGAAPAVVREPVRVKARPLNRPGPAVSVSVTRQHQQQHQQLGAGPSPSPGFLFHDLSPLRGAALKGEAAAPLVSPGWLHHVGDHFFSPGAPSPSSFLDMFGSMPSQHQ